ncbi:MAG: hypothetical protein R2857_00990 [Vampirovibrionales bacterium]
MAKMQLLRQYYDTHIGLKPDEGELKTLLDNYRAAITRAVDEADTVLVNSFGNEQEEIETYRQAGFSHDDFISLFNMTGEALDDAVIHVAASNPNNTVMDLSDDGISTSSMPGTNTALPTIAAPAIASL